MCYRAYLIILVTLLLASQSTWGQERRYRIELLVLSHLERPADLVPETVLTDYSAALDLLAPPPATDSSAREAAQPGAQPAVSASAKPAEQTGATLEPGTGNAVADPPAVVWIETPSETMQLAWRRLRSSSGFRPELYFSWEQSNQPPFPLIRVHDASLLFAEDPYALSNQHPGFAPGADAAGLLPEPARFYRIDGTANFRKTRFLHLDLDLQFRAPVPGTVTEMAMPDLSRASTYDVFAIQQSRRVQTRDVEYFDGPVIGVLALISRVDGESESPDPEAVIPGSDEEAELSD